ncbi:MAG: hypothetical protein RIB98_15120 [Acidimicrobiales bacterium]
MTIVAAATTYLDALISHDADSVPLADHVRRINNGKVMAQNADELRAVIRREPKVTTHGFRWLVDGDHAVTFYDLDADMDGDALIPAYIGERFTVRDGMIEEIEVVYTARLGEPRPPRPERHPAAPGDGDETLAAAQRYVAALVSHDATDVPAASDLWRVENGQVTADDGDELRRSLESEIMHTVQAITDERWFVDGPDAAVFYDLRARIGDGPDDEMTVRIAERFRVVGGQIVEIEAVFAPVPL